MIFFSQQKLTWFSNCNLQVVTFCQQVPFPCDLTFVLLLSLCIRLHLLNQKYARKCRKCNRNPVKLIDYRFKIHSLSAVTDEPMNNIKINPDRNIDDFGSANIFVFFLEIDCPDAHNRAECLKWKEWKSIFLRQKGDWDHNFKIFFYHITMMCRHHLTSV